ncbi:unnamed protein product [marine sediment metagenome]|uniref:Uncharacterized protein n=1 Tax=marine sediment metagenome TaxID=412755 RepID=X1AG83_9ZZZZ
MICPNCEEELSRGQLARLVARGYQVLFVEGRDSQDLVVNDEALKHVGIRCEKVHGCSWGTYLEQLWVKKELNPTDAPVLLGNEPLYGMLYLLLRGYSTTDISLVYCTSPDRVHRKLKTLG